MGWDTGVLIAYYCITSLSIVGSAFVSATIIKFGSNTLSTKLVLYLHISQILQDIFVLPKVFTGDVVLCKIAGWLHIYSGMANIIVVAMMAITYRHLFFFDQYKIQPFMTKYVTYLVFGFPLVSVLPFSTNSYGKVKNDMCSFHKHNEIFWFIGFLIWSVMTGIMCIVLMLTTLCGVFRSDKTYGMQLLKTLGIYSIATMILWIPRFVMNVMNYSNYDNLQFTDFLTSIAGIIYCCIFLFEKKSLKIFELSSNNESLDVNADNSQLIRVSELFSWDVDDENGSNASAGVTNNESRLHSLTSVLM